MAEQSPYITLVMAAFDFAFDKICGDAYPMTDKNIDLLKQFFLMGCEFQQTHDMEVINPILDALKKTVIEP